MLFSDTQQGFGWPAGFSTALLPILNRADGLASFLMAAGEIGVEAGSFGLGRVVGTALLCDEQIGVGMFPVLSPQPAPSHLGAL